MKHRCGCLVSTGELGSCEDVCWWSKPHAGKTNGYISSKMELCFNRKFLSSNHQLFRGGTVSFRGGFYTGAHGIWPKKLLAGLYDKVICHLSKQSPQDKCSIPSPRFNIAPKNDGLGISELPGGRFSGGCVKLWGGIMENYSFTGFCDECHPWNTILSGLMMLKNNPKRDIHRKPRFCCRSKCFRCFRSIHWWSNP